MTETVTLEQYTDALLRERDKRHTQRDRFIQKAIDTALVSINQRLMLLNELRSGVATKEQLDALALRLSDIASRLDTAQGAGAGRLALWQVAVAAVLALGAVFAIGFAFIRH